MTKNKKHKVGILIDKKEIVNWQLYTIDYLQKQKFVANKNRFCAFKCLLKTNQ